MSMELRMSRINTCPDRLLSDWVANGAGGWSYMPSSAWPCFLIGASLDRLSILITGCHVQLRVNSLSMLKLLGCSWISIASLTKRSVYLVAIPNMEVPMKSIWCLVHVRLKQLEKLVVAEHWIDTGHRIDLTVPPY
jgi:hypothetical protein